MLNDKRILSCLLRFDSGAYSSLQFLRAVSHSVSAHTESLHPRVVNSSSSEDEDDERQAPVPAATTSGASESATAAATTSSDDCCDVPRGFALVPCAYARFCEACAIRVSVMDGGCPVCRADITMVMRIFS